MQLAVTLGIDIGCRELRVRDKGRNVVSRTTYTDRKS